MPASLSSIAAKDGTPATIAGGILAVDKSGAGTGPFFAAQTLVDTQGVNTATVKAASTAVAAGDTSIAVGLHPTSPLPAGTNIIGHVIVDTAPSTAVTNAGTFAVQADSSLAQASTTSGQKGVLAQGAVTTASPTYTTAQTSPLSLDTTGALRVNVTAGGAGGGIVTQATAASLNATVQLSDGTHAGTIKAASTAPVAGDTALVVAISPNSVNANGRALPAASAPVVFNSMTYKAVAASATATLFGATGASGDYLDGVLVIPATAAAGVVSITDGGGSAITIFAGGGTTALPTLAPFYVPIGAVSSGGAGGWKVTTGTNVSVIGVGNFT